MTISRAEKKAIDSRKARMRERLTDMKLLKREVEDFFSQHPDYYDPEEIEILLDIAYELGQAEYR